MVDTTKLVDRNTTVGYKKLSHMRTKKLQGVSFSTTEGGGVSTKAAGGGCHHMIKGGGLQRGFFRVSPNYLQDLKICVTYFGFILAKCYGST